MLRRRHQSKAQTVGKAERGQEAYETGRSRRSATRSVFGSLESDGGLMDQPPHMEDATTTPNTMSVASPRRKSLIREYSEAIILAMLLAFAIRVFMVQAFKIPSGSMIPTLLVGDHILVSKLAYGIQWPSDCNFQVTFPPVNCYASHAVI